jgi:hypothetical protein
MTPTTEADLATLFITTIEAVTPRTAFQASTWNAYTRKGEHRRNEPIGAGPKLSGTGAGSRSRRFRLSWAGQPYVAEDALWESEEVETEVDLTVIVDYVGTADEQATIETAVIDDWHQLRDELCRTKGTETGVILVEHGPRPESPGDHEDPTVSRWGLRFKVRYSRRTAETV